MTTKTNNTKTTTTTRRATAAERAATKAVEVASLETLVTAYRTAAGNTSGVEGQMLSLDEQRRVLRVWQARAAVAVFTHPEVGRKYLTAATAVGESRSTFRRFVDGGLKLKNPASTDAPTAHEIKTVNAGWEKVAAEQKTRDAEPKAKVSKVGQPSKSDSNDTEDTTENEAPTFKDVMRQTKALATAVQQVKLANGGKLTAAELKALKSTLQVILNDAAKESTKATPVEDAA